MKPGVHKVFTQKVVGQGPMGDSISKEAVKVKVGGLKKGRVWADCTYVERRAAGQSRRE
jgi:hypothetical protein